MFVAEVAPHVDRLVWAVNDAADESHDYDDAFNAAGIDPALYRRIANYGPVLRKGEVAEDVFYLRHRYNPPESIAGIVATLVAAGCLEETAGGYTATDVLAGPLAAVGEALATQAAEAWAGHTDDVDTLSGLVRRVLDRAPSGPLTDAYRNVPEPADAPALLHQRLAILRLVRNEAHAAAWEARGLTAGDMTVLTSLWDGESNDAVWEGPDGLVVDGGLTEVGRVAREEIEADTNRRNEPAFASLSEDERTAFLRIATALPGTPR